MPGRAPHLAGHCLTMPGDASRTAENGSRFGSRPSALDTLQRHSRSRGFLDVSPEFLVLLARLAQGSLVH
jgi:hypothetical protein